MVRLQLPRASLRAFSTSPTPNVANLVRRAHQALNAIPPLEPLAIEILEKKRKKKAVFFKSLSACQRRLAAIPDLDHTFKFYQMMVELKMPTSRKSYVILMDRCLAQKEGHLARMVYHRFLLDDLPHNRDIVERVARLISVTGTANELIDFYDSIPRLKVDLGLSTLNIFLSGFAKLESPHGAVRAFNAISQRGFYPDLQSYNHLIASHAAVGDAQTCQRLLQQMVTAKFAPSGNTYASLMKCYHQLERYDNVFEILSAARSSEVKLTPHIYSLALKSCASLKDTAKAEEVLAMMKEDGLRINPIVAQAHFNVLIAANQLVPAMELLAHYKRKFAMPAATIGSLIDCCGTQEPIPFEIGEEAYTVVMGKKIDFSAKRNIALAFFRLCLLADKVDVAFTHWEKIKDSLNINGELYVVLLQLCKRHSQPFEQCKKLQQSLEARNKTPHLDARHYSLLIELHELANDLEGAMNQYHIMVKEGVEPNDDVYHSILRVSVASGDVDVYNRFQLEFAKRQRRQEKQRKYNPEKEKRRLERERKRMDMLEAKAEMQKEKRIFAMSEATDVDENDYSEEE